MHINQAIEQEMDTSTNSGLSHSSASLAKRVLAKLEDGDFRRAVCLASSTEPVCRADKESLKLLQEKHPPSHPASSFPTTRHTVTSSGYVLCRCHPCCLFLPHGFCRQTRWIVATAPKRSGHHSLSEGSDRLLGSLTEFVNLVICGKVPANAHPFFFRAILTGLGKKGGGVRPIAVGHALFLCFPLRGRPCQSNPSRFTHWG